MCPPRGPTRSRDHLKNDAIKKGYFDDPFSKFALSIPGKLPFNKLINHLRQDICLPQQVSYHTCEAFNFCPGKLSCGQINLLLISFFS